MAAAAILGASFLYFDASYVTGTRGPSQSQL
jgi:hypothetical protein